MVDKGRLGHFSECCTILTGPGTFGKSSGEFGKIKLIGQINWFRGGHDYLGSFLDFYMIGK